MSIQDMVARLIDAEHISAMRGMRLPSPNALARTLADAGLLAPELPSPDRGMASPSGHVWYPTGPIGDIRATPGRVVCFGMWQDRAFRIVTNPDEARDLAHQILAAAKHAEEPK